MATEAKILITADTSKLDPGLRAATTKLAAFATKANAAFGNLTSTLTGLGGVALFAGLTAGLKKTIDSLEELNNSSKKTGVAVEDLAKLRYAFEQADVPVESLNKGLRFLNRTLGEAKAGNEKATRALTDLGVTTNDTALPAILKIADAIAQIPDAAERATKLNEVFGKSWEDLVPGLSQGSGELARLAQELERLGGVPSQKAAEAADALNDNLGKLATSITGPLTVGIGNLLPYVQTLSERFVAVSKAAGGFLQTLEDIGKRVGLGRLIQETRSELGGLKDKLADLRAQESAGDFPFFGGTAELYKDIKQTEDAIARVEQRLIRLRERAGELQKSTPAVDVLIQGDPEAMAKLTADATAASQAAQAAVPPIVVPIAVGPTGAIGSYADLQAEFARQQEGFAAGGAIRGPGGGTSDSILARVSNGEHVIRAAAVARYGRGFMDAINQMSLPRFAAGGPVGSSPTATYHLNLNGKTLAATAPAGAAADFAAELRREVVRRGRR